MTTFEIYQKIIKLIEEVSTEGTVKGEVDIVRESINRIKDEKWNSNVKVRTGFCHQKPYAFFVKPKTLFTKVKTELGDFLFVIKYLDNKEIIDHRALFFQAKYKKTFDSFGIELHQFHFYNQIENIEFRFGNIVYKDLNIKPIIWKNISKPKEFGDYILIGDNNCLDLYTSEIGSQYSHKHGQFKYDLNARMNGCWHLHTRHRFLCPCNFSPLFDFLSPNGRGNKIEGQFEIFMSLIYKKLDMIPDPPEEHEGFWEDNKDGFGIVEITINNNESNSE